MGTRTLVDREEYIKRITDAGRRPEERGFIRSAIDSERPYYQWFPDEEQLTRFLDGCFAYATQVCKDNVTGKDDADSWCLPEEHTDDILSIDEAFYKEFSPFITKYADMIQKASGYHPIVTNYPTIAIRGSDFGSFAGAFSSYFHNRNEWNASPNTANRKYLFSVAAAASSAVPLAKEKGYVDKYGLFLVRCALLFLAEPLHEDPSKEKMEDVVEDYIRAMRDDIVVSDEGFWGPFSNTHCCLTDEAYANILESENQINRTNAGRELEALAGMYMHLLNDSKHMYPICPMGTVLDTESGLLYYIFPYVLTLCALVSKKPIERGKKLYASMDAKCTNASSYFLRKKQYPLYTEPHIANLMLVTKNVSIKTPPKGFPKTAGYISMYTKNSVTVPFFMGWDDSYSCYCMLLPSTEKTLEVLRKVYGLPEVPKLRTLPNEAMQYVDVGFQHYGDTIMGLIRDETCYAGFTDIRRFMKGIKTNQEATQNELFHELLFCKEF